MPTHFIFKVYEEPTDQQLAKNNKHALENQARSNSNRVESCITHETGLEAVKK